MGATVQTRVRISSARGVRGGSVSGRIGSRLLGMISLDFELLGNLFESGSSCRSR